MIAIPRRFTFLFLLALFAVSASGCTLFYQDNEPVHDNTTTFRDLPLVDSGDGLRSITESDSASQTLIPLSTDVESVGNQEASFARISGITVADQETDVTSQNAANRIPAHFESEKSKLRLASSARAVPRPHAQIVETVKELDVTDGQVLSFDLEAT